ncbi:MAG: acyl-CoA thioesterase [Anaerolineae bacterium]|jgi:acyl-CoA thioester hydrolase|nr:acyl-CoA thioesterase [Anaerolineae bacterium]
MSEPKPTVQRADFPHFLSIPTCWMDNDIYGHLNNALYYAFFDTVINQYLIAEGGLDIHTGDIIGLAVETHCQFFQPIAFPEVIDAGLRVGKLGNSSVRYEVGLFRHGQTEAAAFGYFVHVFVDRASRRPSPMPDRLRASLQRLVRG